MIGRPPSLQREWTTFWSRDPAFIPWPVPPSTDTDEAAIKAYFKARDEHAERVRVADETNGWASLLIEGETATQFVLQPIDRNIWRAIAERMALPDENPRVVGIATLPALLFRLAIKSIPGFEMKVERKPDKRWENWVMAQSELVTALDEISPNIIAEIGTRLYTRLQSGVPPK